MHMGKPCTCQLVAAQREVGYQRLQCQQQRQRQQQQCVQLQWRPPDFRPLALLVGIEADSEGKEGLSCLEQSSE